MRIKNIFNSLSLCFYILVCELVVLSQANPYFATPNRDSGMFLYFGRMILYGKTPYRDIWDNKPPGVYFINALGLWIGQDTRWGVWLLEWVFLLTAIILGYRLLKDVYGKTAAILGTLAWLLGLKQVLNYGNGVEEYSLLFSFIALSLFIHSISSLSKRAYIFDIAIGAAAAINFSIRANNIGAQLAIITTLVLWAWINRDYKVLFKRLTWIIAGGLITLLVIAGYCQVNGFLGSMLQAAVFYNYFYSGNHFNLQNGISSGFVNLSFVAWMALTGYLFLIYFLVVKKNSHKISPFYLLVLVSWPIEIILSSLSGRGYEHYYINWMPSFCLSCGFLVYFAGSRFNAFIEKYHQVFLVILALSLAILFKGDLAPYRSMFMDRMNHGTWVEKMDPMSEYIIHHSGPNDKILAWGGQLGINFLSRRNTLDAYYEYPLYVSSPFTQTITEQFYNDLSQNSPLYIIDCAPDAPGDIPPLNLSPKTNLELEAAGYPQFPANYPQVNGFIGHNYHLETKIGAYKIYRQNP